MSVAVETPTSGALTRMMILEAAARSFEAKGFKATTLDDIAKEAGVSRRVIYHHFTSKLEILQMASLEQARQFLHTVRSAVSVTLPFPQYVAECLYFVIDQAPSSRLFMLDYAREASFDPVQMYFENTELIDEWVEFFREPYTQALRKNEVNSQVILVKLVHWFGRICTSYLQYPLAGESQEDIRESLRVFVAGALARK